MVRRPECRRIRLAEPRIDFATAQAPVVYLLR